MTRWLYEQTALPVSDLIAYVGCGRTCFFKTVREQGWAPRRDRRPPFKANACKLRRMQRDYEETDKMIAEITASHDCSQRTLYRLRKELDWMPRRILAPPLRPEPADASSSVGGAEPPRDQAAIGAEVQRTIELELEAISQILQRMGGSTDARQARAERAARTLAILTRTLNEVKRMRVAAAKDVLPASARDSDDDRMPRDRDEFRQEVARRIDAFVASRAHRTMDSDAEDSGA